ncbi:acyl-CoA dehydrogenase, partial [bacterium]|nr:acyl-CoA dehydrogenase [bacterium]
IALDYIKVRKQFGRPIGSFQTLQHRAVDLKIQLELTRAVLNECSGLFDGSADLSTRQTAVSRAKARASDAAMLVAKESTQFHGAMGITDEADVGLYSRKILTLYNQYGTAAWHRSRYFSLNEPACAAAGAS